MNAKIRGALARNLTIDMTTTGRRSGKPGRTEIRSHRTGGRYHATGTPGRRDWHANLLADPWSAFRLKEPVRADLPARAAPVTGRAERRRVFLAGKTIWERPDERTIEEWVEHAPRREVTFEESPDDRMEGRVRRQGRADA
jgi:hypothetical protein